MGTPPVYLDEAGCSAASSTGGAEHRTDAPLTTAGIRSVLCYINCEHGTRYALRRKFPVGTESAWLVDDRAGGRLSGASGNFGPPLVLGRMGSVLWE